MNRYMRMSLLAATIVAGLSTAATGTAEPGARDLTFFLRRLRTLDHLPELEPSHTAMSSTWDRSGGNLDGWDFKRVEGDRNVLLDVNGPGCIHRMFTGWLGQGKDILGRPGPVGTRIQIFLDREERPVLDLPIERFFDDRNGPFPYPLVFHKTYPGTLFPIPFARHCRVQLVSPEGPNWGNFWQITYTTYPPATRVKSLTWPLSDAEVQELRRVREAWLEAESRLPAAPAEWAVVRDLDIGPGEVNEVRIEGVSRGAGVPPLRPAGILPAEKEQGQDALATEEQGQDALATGCGVIRQMRVGIWPPTPELLRGIRLQIRWDGAEEPDVDVPLGYFFGNADYAYANEIHFNSLLLGVTPSEAYCCFPMPFARGAVLRFENRSEQRAHRIHLSLDVERRETLPDSWGRFHATWTEARAAQPGGPRFGPQNIPVHIVLDREGPGKYVGVLLHVQWPHRDWWGEGDWLIWTDENAWPPSYHGTGSEEYFNSGWCSFDRKAVSGFIKTHPGEVALYSFHLNDAFQFQRNIRVAEETFGMDGADMIGNTIIQRDHPVWGSTAYWYARHTESILPGEDIQARVNAASPGTTFLLRSGVHRMQSIVPRDGDTFTGEAGTVLSGARLLTAPVRSGSYWVVAGQTQHARDVPGEGPCRKDYPRCNYPEGLFMDDVPLLHVADLNEAGPGKWHFDYAADRIILGDDPAGKKVELSVTPKAFTGSATGVTIRNLTIEKYANPTQQGTVELGDGWIIEGCEVRWNHFTGIATGPRSVSRGNRVHHNGCFGFHGAGEDTLVENNEIAYNGFAGYDPFWGAGGSKWVHTSHLVVRGNFSHHNLGPGLWTDINNIHSLYENNIVEDNERGGIFHEISYDATIRNNTARRNGTGKHFPHWTTGAGIEVVSSRNVEVYGNTLEDNWQGITGLDDHRGTGIAGPWTLINLNVHDNAVTTRVADDGGGRTGIIDTEGTGAFAAAANNRFRRNTYSLGTRPQYFFWTGKELGETQWRELGQDMEGTFRR